MLPQLLRALISTPYHGALTLLTAFPILLAGAFTMAVIPVSPVLPVIWVVLSLVTWTAVYAQASRTAASVTGLKSLIDQPGFFVSLRRGAPIAVAVSILGAMFLGATMFSYVRHVGAERFWWTDMARLEEAFRLMGTPEGQETLLTWSFDLGALPIIFQVVSAVFIFVAAIFVLPRTIRLRDDFASAYLPLWIGIRFLVALPIFAFLAAFVEDVITTAGASALASAGQPDIYVRILGPLFAAAFFTGMAFAFEARLLRLARSHELDRRAGRPEEESQDALQARALRAAWSQR